MRCSRVVMLVLVTVFGGAVMSLGLAEACPGSPTEHYDSMIPSDLCPTENYAATSDSDTSADSAQSEEADYYDRGEVAASAEDPSAEDAAVEDASQDASQQSKSDYRYEYPEESYARYGEADFAEQYSKDDSWDASSETGPDYGDESSEEDYARYGEGGSEGDYAEQYSKDDSRDASSETGPDYGDESSEEDYARYGEAGSEGDYAEQYSKDDSRDASSETGPDYGDESSEGDYARYGEAGSEGDYAEQYSKDDSRDASSETGPDYGDESSEGDYAEQYYSKYGYEYASPEEKYGYGYAEHGMENLTAEEDSDAAETYYPTEEEMLARTELAPEIVDAVASEENDEIGPYQMEEYHPRYGYRFGYRRSYYAGPAWEETSTSDQSPTAAAVPTPAAETESAQPEPQPGSVAERYGYAEYMGEDYLSELEDSSRAAVDPEQQRQADPQDSEPTDPESDSPMTPEKNASVDADNPEMAAAETDGLMGSEFGESTSSNYDDAEPYRYYGHDYGRETAEREENASDSDQSLRIEESSPMEEPQAQDTTESGIELFAYRPTELLTSSDQDLLRTLSRLLEEPSGVRRAVLNDYLETQGTDALDFAARFEDLTGIEFLGLADDLPGVAAFLASYRLLEQSELGVDEASDLLRRSLQRFAPDWVNGVDEITADAQNGMSEPVSADSADSDSSMGSANNQVLKALGVLASQSLREIGELADGIPSRFSQVAWTVLLPQFGHDWSVGSLSGVSGDLQR